MNSQRNKRQTLDDLENFKSFIYRSFKEYDHYKKMFPRIKQPGHLYLTLKTHKPKNIEDVTLEEVKFYPVIAQSDTNTHTHTHTHF